MMKLLSALVFVFAVIFGMFSAAMAGKTAESLVLNKNGIAAQMQAAHKIAGY